MNINTIIQAKSDENMGFDKFDKAFEVCCSSSGLIVGSGYKFTTFVFETVKSFGEVLFTLRDMGVKFKHKPYNMTIRIMA